MADEADGVDEAFEASLRVGLTVVGRMAEQAARAREQAARDAQASSEQQARELAGRLDSERLAARAQLAAIEHDQWWTAAEPDRIAEVWQTACAWRELDPEAVAAADRIRTQVRDRYGIDADEPRADAGALPRPSVTPSATPPTSSAARAAGSRSRQRCCSPRQTVLTGRSSRTRRHTPDAEQAGSLNPRSGGSRMEFRDARDVRHRAIAATRPRALSRQPVATTMTTSTRTRSTDWIWLAPSTSASTS